MHATAASWPAPCPSRYMNHDLRWKEQEHLDKTRKRLERRHLLTNFVLILVTIVFAVTAGIVLARIFGTTAVHL
jgi:hypothetical protein